MKVKYIIEPMYGLKRVNLSAYVDLHYIVHDKYFIKLDYFFCKKGDMDYTIKRAEVAKRMLEKYAPEIKSPTDLSMLNAYSLYQDKEYFDRYSLVLKLSRTGISENTIEQKLALALLGS